MEFNLLSMMKKFRLGILCGLTILFSNSVISQNVWTQHNDLGRTGWYPYETILNTTNVGQNTFGLNFNHTTDDKIISQPLVVLHVNIPGNGIHNIVYITTVNNTIYAYDADVNAQPYWVQNYTNIIAPAGNPQCPNNCRPAYYTDIHPSLCATLYPDFDGNMGIVGTPVIDTLAGTMYFVTKIVNPNDGPIDNHTFVPNSFNEYTYTTTGFHQYLHAIDIATGLDRANSPVEITATVNGTGDGQKPASSGHIVFEPRRQFDRAGLVLNNGILYIAFAAHCDFVPSHGWVMSYNPSSLTQLHAMVTTPNDGRGGIWMSGTAPAVDASGNLYFTTGNAQFEDAFGGGSGEINFYNAPATDPSNRGESVIKLAPDLTLSSYFTPFDYVALNDADKDFPIQVMLLPGTGHLLTGNKDDSLFILDQTNLGGFNPALNNVLQSRFVVHPCEMHSSFAYFGGPTQYAYQYGENSPLKAYPITAGGLLGTEITNTTILGPTGGSGGFMSVSSNGADPTTGILWAVQAQNGCNANGSTCQGILHAMNASNITKELWNSDMNPGVDHLNVFNKMSCPTIALGKVYLTANKNQLNVYGLKTNASCLTNVALGKPATALSSAGGFPPSNVTDGDPGTAWISGNGTNVDSIYVDLGSRYDVCRILINWSTFGVDFDLKTSNDGINWTTVDPVRGNTSATTEFDGAFSGRYVSMVGITKGSGPYGIFEFEVFGTPSVTCPAPSILNASPGSNVNIFTTQTPTSPSGTDAPVELGVQFTSAISGFITGVRFFEDPGFGGTHIGQLYTIGGTLIPGASGTFTGESLNGWQTLTFGTPVAILAGTTYVAAVYFTNGYHMGDKNGLATAISNFPLTALANGGVYTYSPTLPAFPTSAFMSSNYWIDVNFSTTATPDPSMEVLSWDAQPGASQYIIQYRNNLSSSFITRTSTTNSQSLSALTCGTLYDYTIQTDCGTSKSTLAPGSFTTASCPVNSCLALPVRYFNLDLGDIGIAGSTCKLGPTLYQLTGSGNISGNVDAFQYAFTSNDIADYDVSGQIIQQDQVSANNQIGIMVRDSLSNTSRFAFIASVNNGTSFVFEYRDVAGGSVTIVPLAGHALPYWVKISKSGTTYSAFISADDITWNQVGSTVDLHFGTDASNAPHYGMGITSSNNTVLSTGEINNFSVLGSSPLPITLLSFTAKDINHDHVLVSWATSMEHLVDHFEIQRSIDNSSFQAIAEVKAVGESEIPHYYSVNDNNPSVGVNYYRLKEFDKDGNFYFSPVVSVNFAGPEGVEIYPNPASDFTNINSLKYPILEVNLYDITGKLLKSIQPPSGGLTSVKLSTSDLSSGVYIVAVKTTLMIYRQKLSKQ
jgi:hypothetical protein